MSAILAKLSNAFAGIGSTVTQQSRNILFTLGYFVAITGICLKDFAAGLIIAGVVVCSLMIWDMVRNSSNKP